MDVAGYDFTGNGSDNQCSGSDFHRLSQDIRNPLHSIIGFAELLLMDEGLSLAHADYVRAILTGSEALMAAVVSYLDRADESVPSAAAPFAEAQPAPRRRFSTERSGAL